MSPQAPGMLSRRELLRAAPAALATLAAGTPLGSSGADSDLPPPRHGLSTRRPRAGDGVATLDLGARPSLRILQITDNHFFCGVKEGLAVTEADRRTESDWQAHVRHRKPDLIVVTGDLWHDNPGGRGQKALEHVLPKLARLETPWAFCWGNHDELDDFQTGHDALESAAGSLYRGGASHGDYRIEVRGAGGQPVAHLFFMNSHKDGLSAWQLAWLRRTQDALAVAGNGAGPLPALGFFHIPLLDQKTLYRSDRIRGLKNEEVCHEKESGSALPVLAGKGNIRACFCGHDHVNDYAVRDREVDLVYGRATGYGGYGGEVVPKGAKLIEFDVVRGSCTQVTVFADGSTWKPA